VYSMESYYNTKTSSTQCFGIKEFTLFTAFIEKRVDGLVMTDQPAKTHCYTEANRQCVCLAHLRHPKRRLEKDFTDYT